MKRTPKNLLRFLAAVCIAAALWALMPILLFGCTIASLYMVLGGEAQ